jgi:hypothetical protein
MKASSERNPLKIIIAGAVMLLCDGCVSQTRCIVYAGKNGSQLEINQTTCGLIAGICGFTTHASSGCTFYLPETKDVYEGGEIAEKGINSNPSTRYAGSISFLRAKGQVAINLTRDGRPFEFNGKFQYRSERNDALSP